MKKRLLAILAITIFCSKSKAQLFTQNFESSSVIGDYINNTSPNIGQFNNISTGTGLTTSINSGQLRIVRTASAAVFAYRNVSVTTPPSFTQLKFDFTVSANDINKANSINVFIGNGFSNTTNGPGASHASSYVSRIGISTTANVGDFRVGTIDALPLALTSGIFSGKQTISFTVNKSGATRTYSAPDNTTESVANETMEVWIGTTRVIDDFPLINMQNTTNLVPLEIRGFKIQATTTSGLGTFDFDNFVFTDLLGTSVVPVKLTSFSGKSINNELQLNWTTATEVNNSHFEVLKSTNGIEFNSIGVVRSEGNGNENTNYQFYDKDPIAGTNYYQLKQVDNDGKYSIHKTIAVEHKKSNDSNIKLIGMSNNEVKLAIYMPKATQGFLKLINIDGKTIYQTNNNFNEGINTVSVPTINVVNKLYIAQFISAKEIISLKIIKN